MTGTTCTGSRAPRPDPLVPHPVRLARVHRENGDTFTWEIGTAGIPGGFRFRPGQFSMLYVFGTGEVPISISGDPVDGSKVVHTIRAVGSVTRVMAGLAAGATVGIRGPYGIGWPMEEIVGRDVVVMAGGIGLAPLRPAIYHLLAHRERYGRVTLLHGARSDADLAFVEEIRSWRSRLDCEVRVTVDRGGPDWHGPVGVITQLLPGVPVDPAKTAVLMCGPEIMMRFAARDLEALGLGRDSIWVTMERNMKCAVGFCGHCQYGPEFVCKDGPVFRFDRVAPLFHRKEV